MQSGCKWRSLQQLAKRAKVKIQILWRESEMVAKLAHPLLKQHQCEPDAFGLTRKPYLTPLGETGVDLRLVDELIERGGPAVRAEDYCHSVEHSIEFQVVFLQHLFGPGVRVVPILCGAFARSTRPLTRPLGWTLMTRLVSWSGVTVPLVVP